MAPITLKPLSLKRRLHRRRIRAEDLDFTSIRIYRDGTLYQLPVRDLYDGSAPRIQLTDGDSVFVDTEYELSQAQAYFEEQIRLAEFRQRARIQALNELQTEVNLRRAALNEARSNFNTRADLDAVDRDYVYLVGEVAAPGALRCRSGVRPRWLMCSLAKGPLTRTANPRQIYVLRGSTDPREFSAMDAWQLDAGNAAAFLVATRFEMRPNDVIFMSEQPVTRWNRVVNQITPALINTGLRTATNN